MEWNEYMNSHNVKIDYVLGELKASQGADAIRELAAAFEKDERVLDHEAYLADVFAREQLESTYVGNGVSIPHARSAHVTSAVIAVGRSREGLQFENCPDKVHLLVCVGVPRPSVKEYLAFVGKLSRTLKVPENRSKLLEAASDEELLEFFRAEGL